MAKLLLILPALFATCVKASGFWGVFLDCRRASEAVVDTRLGIDKISEQPSLPMRPASAALLRSLKKTDSEAKEFRDFIYINYLQEARLFDQMDSFAQDISVNLAFAQFLSAPNNHEAGKSLIINHVLPVYPILEGQDFDFENFLSYLNPPENKNLASFLDEKVFIAFKELLGGILKDGDESTINIELGNLFSKAHKSMYSADKMITHSFHVAVSAHADFIRNTNDYCSKTSADLQNYMLCTAKSLEYQMYVYLCDHQSGYEEYMHILTCAFFASAAKNGLTKLVGDFVAFRSSAAVTKRMLDPEFTKLPFILACQNEQMSIMELIIDADPSISIASQLKCNALTLATLKRNDKLFYQLLSPYDQNNRSSRVSNDITGAIELAIKDNNLTYLDAILDRFEHMDICDVTKWMADAMESENRPLETVLMKHSPHLMSENSFEDFQKFVNSRDSSKLRSLCHEI